MSRKLFSVVIPIYKATENLPHTIPYIMEQIPILFQNYDVELVMVNDNPPDASWEMMKEYQKQYPEIIHIASFTQNYGQGAAIVAGMKLAHGDVVGVISQDLQDPFELFADMLEAIERGHDLVCAVREKNEERGLMAVCSKTARKLMHKFISPQLPAGGCDYFAADRRAVNRFFEVYRKGTLLLPLLEASSVTKFIPYVRRARKFGKSGYSFWKKVNVLINEFVVNTYLPLRVVSVSGMAFSGLAFLFAIVILIAALFRHSPIPVQGWASLALLITFFSGLILASIGIVGEYLWRVFDEVKKKPRYLIAEEIKNDQRICVPDREERT